MRGAKGKKMLLSEGYCLTYDKNHNRISIGLPQTFETVNSTYEQILDRITDVEEKDLLVLLNVVKLIFYKAERREDGAQV